MENEQKRGSNYTSKRYFLNIFYQKPPIIIFFVTVVIIIFRDLSNNELRNLPPYIFRNITAIEFL